jgi:hypothetical protein
MTPEQFKLDVRGFTSSGLTGRMLYELWTGMTLGTIGSSFGARIPSPSIFASDIVLYHIRCVFCIRLDGSF